MKRLLIALLLLEVGLITLLAAPVLHKRDGYDRAQNEYRKEATGETSDAWDREQHNRAVQVKVAFATIATLCLNACVICWLFSRLMGDPKPPRRSRAGTLSPQAKRKVRLALGALIGSIVLIVGGSIVFARALATPSPAGLWSLVAVLLGVAAAFVSGLAWVLARSPDQATPVEGDETDTADENTDSPQA